MKTRVLFLQCVLISDLILCYLYIILFIKLLIKSLLVEIGKLRYR